MMKLTVKWGTATLNDLYVEPSTTAEDFKALLAARTNVPAARQRILGFKNGVLKNGTTLAAAGLRERMQLILVGTPEGAELTETGRGAKARAAPQTTTALAVAAPTAPAGLINLGNTCYLNSVLQLLRRSPEFCRALLNLRLSPTAEDHALCTALQAFLSVAEITGASAFPPTLVVDMLRQRFPQFASKTQPKSAHDPPAGYAQQDAEECLSAILSVLIPHSPQIKDIFEIGFRTQVKKAGPGGEALPELSASDVTRMLSCYTAAGGDEPVSFLEQGLKLYLEDEEENGTHGRLIKTKQLEKLPEYLFVHFVRFEWKEANDLARTSAVRAKVCRRIAFPNVLDVFSYCTPEVQGELLLGRRVRALETESELKKHRADAERLDEAPPTTAAAPPAAAAAPPAAPAATSAPSTASAPEAAAPAATVAPAAPTEPVAPAAPASPPAAAASAAEPGAPGGEHAMVEDGQAPAEAAQSATAGPAAADAAAASVAPRAAEGAAGQAEAAEGAAPPPAAAVATEAAGLPTGNYELVAVLTHQGRDASSGHYVAWTRKDADTFYMLDDDKVTEVAWKSVDLAGGRSDYHLAIILMYRKLRVFATPDIVQQARASGN